MQEFVGERRPITPSEQLKDEFRQLVVDSYGREPLRRGISVHIDENGHGISIESEEQGATPGDRTIVYTTYRVDFDGTVSKTQDCEPLGKRLARDIKKNTVCPEPAQNSVLVDELMKDFAMTRADAIDTELWGRLLSINPETYAALTDHIDMLEQAQQLGFNDVEAFELHDAMELVRFNFPLLP